MHLRFRALQYAIAASLAASGMAAAQAPQNPPTTDQAQTSPQTTPGSTTQSATEPTQGAAQTPGAAAPVAGGPSATPKKSATEEIVVTGTRVRRKDLNTPAPVTVLSRDQITASGRVSLGEFLQALPEQGNTVNAQVNNGNDGSVRVALRSLGSNRTLVLVNGRRMVPGGTGADSAADLSTIPAAAIERIEVLKDGASAIYGSDAIAGVVNVILRKRYNGTEVGGYAGVSQRGDGETYDVHGVTGTAGDRGSMLFSIGYQEQRPVFAADRRWSYTSYNWDFDQNCYPDVNTGECIDRYAKDSAGNYRNGTGNSSTWPQGRFSLPSGAAACSASGTKTAALQQVCSIFAATGSNNYEPDGHGGFEQFPSAANPSGLYNTNPTNYLITPSRRIQLFGTGDVNLGSEARAFFEASYVNRTSSQSLAPMPIVGTTIPTAPVFISKDSIYNPFGVTITSWRRRSVEFGERFWKQDLDTFRVVAGLDGSLGEWAGPLSGWSWGVDYNHGRTAGSQFESGQIQMSHLANALGPSAINPKTGKPVCLRTALSAGGTLDSSNIIGGCIPMDVLHGVGSLSPEAKSYVSYDGTDFGHDQQDIFSAQVSGELFKLASERPAGLALGADYRRESASFINNPININDSSGNNALSTSGGYNVKEAYGELVIPLIGGMPFVEDLELQAAVRWNDFSTFGTQSTYKLGARWSPIRDITARATYGTAYRAPNVGELYGGAADDYPTVRDPCNNPKDPVILQRCKDAGVPGGNSRDPSTQLLSKHVANSQLGPEDATVFTAGVVLQPQMVRNFSVTVDYYNINVSKTISTRGAAFILNQCYRAEVQDKSMCDLVIRNSDGQVLQINDERANLGNYHTTGLDFAVRYALGNEDFGRFNWIFDGTYLNSYRVTDILGVVTNGAGNYDLGALPRLKFNTGIFWNLGPIGAGVSARYVGNFKECPNSSCDTDTQARQIGHYLPFDVFASYTLKGWAAGTTQLVVGVQNIADEEPPFLYTASAANTDPSTYDYIGRFFYTRLTHTF